MVFVRFVVMLGLAALTGVSLMGSFAGWPGDMIAPFRIQLLIVALLGLGAALAMRRQWIIMAAAVAIAANALPMALRVFDRPTLPAMAAQGRAVSLVFSNVLCDNRDFDRVVALADTQNADLFAAAETTPEWTRHLDTLKSRYPYSFSPNLGIFGVALYARRPFTPALFRLGRRHMPLLRADFGDMVVYVAHPMPPANARLTTDNDAYMRDMAGLIARETKPVIVAGDLNATLWSHSLAPLMKLKMQWPKGSGMAYSWPAGKPWLRIQIDQILTRRAVAGRYRTLGDVGSDHYPVRADLIF